MYKAFVVDDEPSVIEGMKIMIPWNELDFELCGSASNAQEALLKIEELRPHLLITDIRMPHKSGLELINEVRKLNLNMEFVILSGYSEFSYAQDAMRRDFLNQPPENPVYYPCWNINLIDGSDAQMANQQLTDASLQYLPQAIMADPSEFEKVWADYMTAIGKINVKALEDRINAGIQERIANWGN